MRHYSDNREASQIPKRENAWTAVGAFVGMDWGVAFAVMIEGLGGVIPTAASVAMVVALGLLGGGLGFHLGRKRAGDA